jgi:hypothetical protein
LTRVVLGYVAQAFLIMFNRSFSTESLTKGPFLCDQAAQRKLFKTLDCDLTGKKAIRFRRRRI